LFFINFIIAALRPSFISPPLAYDGRAMLELVVLLIVAGVMFALDGCCDWAGVPASAVKLGLKSLFIIELPLVTAVLVGCA
jgi:hypothetical protein